MTPLSTESTTARATAACAGPNICTACLAPLMVTLLNRMVSGLAGRFGATTASRVVKPSLLFVSALQNATPAGPDFEPMTRSMCATSLPSPTSDSPRKKSAAIGRTPVVKGGYQSGQTVRPKNAQSGRACRRITAIAGQEAGRLYQKTSNFQPPTPAERRRFPGFQEFGGIGIGC